MEKKAETNNMYLIIAALLKQLIRVHIKKREAKYTLHFPQFLLGKVLLFLFH